MAKIDRKPAKHHLLIIDTIEKLLRNELKLPDGKVAKNVIFLMPPGSAKSTYTSILLPAWFLNPEQYPHDLMLACSYSYTLIEGFGKRARDTVEEESNVLGISLSKTSSAAGDWRISHAGREDGGYFCAGVNAGIAGHRGRLGLIDDFIGTEEEADSKVIRDKNWEWYWNDFVPRLLPDAWQIIIANRRHEDDLVGRLMAEEGTNWYMVKLPMLAEENDPLGRVKGERLWPEWFTEEQVRLAKKLPRTWAGLYQQRPAPEEGNFFKRENLLGYSINELPKNLRKYCTSDWALRKKDANDWTCHLSGGLDDNGRLWILPDWYWEKSDTLVSTEEMFKMQVRHEPTFWWHGKENITGAIGPFVTNMMRDKGTYINIIELSEAKDKQAKASAICAMTQAKMVMFPKFHPNWERAETELLNFPGGLHDDFVDALAKFGQGLALMHAPGKQDKPWNGVIETPKLTCGWMQRSHNRKERKGAFGTFREKFIVSN